MQLTFTTIFANEIPKVYKDKKDSCASYNYGTSGCGLHAVEDDNDLLEGAMKDPSNCQKLPIKRENILL